MTLVGVQATEATARMLGEDKSSKSGSFPISLFRLLFGVWVVCAPYALSPDYDTCHSLTWLLACATCILSIHPSSIYLINLFINSLIHLFNQHLLNTSVWHVRC